MLQLQLQQNDLMLTPKCQEWMQPTAYCLTISLLTG